MQDTAPCTPQRSPLCLSMPAPPRRHPMLSGLLVLLLSVTYVMGADEEESRSPLVHAMAASEREQIAEICKTRIQQLLRSPYDSSRKSC
jgi:hypothetical protein